MKTEIKDKPAESNTSQWILASILYAVFFGSLMYFSDVYKVILNFNSSFRFKYMVTPMSGLSSPIILTGLYVILIPIIPKFMANRQPFKFYHFTILHNFALTILSLVLFFTIFPYAIEGLTHGFHYAVCSSEMHENAILHAAYYFNYLLKYYEFIDTFLLVLKKKPVQTLHFYHHAMTLVLTYTQLLAASTVQWIPIIINLFVHIIMYYYYALSALGVRDIWWKQYLTMLQIAQFVIDVAVCWYCYTSIFNHPLSCHTSIGGAESGIAVLSSYLLLFLSFYSKTYHKKAE